MSGDTPWSHAAFARHLGLPFPLLSDSRWEAARAFGVLDPELYGLYRPRNRRAAFLVGAGGVVRFARAKADQLDVVHPDELLGAIRSLSSPRRMSDNRG